MNISIIDTSQFLGDDQQFFATIFQAVGIDHQKEHDVPDGRPVPFTDPWGWGGPGAMRAAFVNSGGAPTNEVKEPSGVNQRLPNWLDMGKKKREGATWPFGTSASAFGGKHSLVVWQRHHLAGEKMTTFTNSNLIAARVDGFRSLDPDGVPVAASAHDELSPALAGDGRGTFLLAYEQQREDGAAFVCLKVLSAN